MTRSGHGKDVPIEVRSAIRQFLNDAQSETDTFSLSQAIGAIRRVFPDLDVSDRDLIDAIASEASVAGFEIEYGAESAPKALKRRRLEQWDNEGGAVGKNGDDR